MNLAEKHLPTELPTLINAAYGDGSICGVCGEPIRAADVEYDVFFYESGRSILMHLRCYASWESGRQAP
jgi:hypothetical protein